MKELDSSKIKILVCCHKKCELPQDDILLPIHVGAALSAEDLGMQRDDQVNGQPCDNISVKNKNYCELTAMYWAWKNIKKLYPDIEYIGLNHYRRFFDFQDKWNSEQNISAIRDYQINKKKLSRLLKDNSVIMHKNDNWWYSVRHQYCYCHFSSDYETLKSRIIKEYEDYRYSFLHIFEFGNEVSLFNMFIMPISFFEQYCEWLFPLLEGMEHEIDFAGRDEYQRRVFGFLAERLQNVFVYKNAKRLRLLPVMMFKDNIKAMRIEKKSLHHKILDFLIFQLYLFRSTDWRTKISIFFHKIGIRER